MPRYRSFDVAFKRQVAQEFLTGESLNSLSRKYDIARNLIRIWVLKHEGGEFEPEFEHDNRLKAHEVKIAGLEPVGENGKQQMAVQMRRRLLPEDALPARLQAMEIEIAQMRSSSSDGLVAFRATDLVPFIALRRR
jgi:transposase